MNKDIDITSGNLTIKTALFYVGDEENMVFRV